MQSLVYAVFRVAVFRVAVFAVFSVYAVFSVAALFSFPAWLKPVLASVLCLRLPFFPMAEDRVVCDPSITVGDLESVFTSFFAMHSRDLQPLLDSWSMETWKTSPKALEDLLFNKTLGCL